MSTGKCQKMLISFLFLQEGYMQGYPLAVSYWKDRLLVITGVGCIGGSTTESREGFLNTGQGRFFTKDFQVPQRVSLRVIPSLSL